MSISYKSVSSDGRFLFYKKNYVKCMVKFVIRKKKKKKELHSVKATL